MPTGPANTIALDTLLALSGIKPRTLPASVIPINVNAVPGEIAA
jgi:hypothetical protein